MAKQQTADDIKAQVTALVRERGVIATARQLCTSREAVARVVADLPVRRGTLALIERSLTTEPPSSDSVPPSAA